MIRSRRETNQPLPIQAERGDVVVKIFFRSRRYRPDRLAKFFKRSAFVVGKFCQVFINGFGFSYDFYSFLIGTVRRAVANWFACAPAS